MENDQSLIKMPGYRTAEYILILSPHASLQEKIMRIKKDILEKYDNGFLVNRKPVIRLARFFSYQMMEEKLINHFKIAGMAMPPFKVTLKDFGSFPQHTLFVNVDSRVPLQMLMKDIKSAKRLMRSPGQAPYFTNEFNIPLAIKLTPLQYEKMWEEYRRRQFTGHFIADAMLLLKRREGEKNYQIAARFEFQNLPVSVRQGELFG
ncbi:MAG: 2'-5' RNA ligase family protein [Ginsengibacter sp.]|jgi:2'-5' RNA ligase